MQKLQWAVALIRTHFNNERRWLATRTRGVFRNEPKLSFIMAERLENESFREALFREVAWELELDRRRDFLVSNMAQLNMELIERLPGQTQTTHSLVSFYNVDIYRGSVCRRLARDSNVCWLDSSEVCDGVTRHGQILDPLVPWLINRSNVIQHWESSEG